MAFTVTNLGFGSDASLAGSKAITGVTASVGDLIFVAVTSGNTGTSGAAVTVTCTDSQSNTYTQRTQVNRTPGSVVDDGATLTIFTAVLTSALSSGSITVSFSPSATGVIVHAKQFAPGAGETASYISAGAGASGASASPSITTGTITNGDTVVGAIAYVYLGATLTGDSDTSNGSWSTNYGQTVSGTATLGLGSQQKTVSAGATQTYDPTLSASRQYATNYIVIRSASSAATLTPSLFTNGQTFYSATVTPGGVGLTPSLFTNSQAFYAASVAPGAVTLTPSLFTNGQIFYSATVSAGALQPGLFTNAQTFFAPTITPGPVSLLPSLFTNSQTFHAASVTSVYALYPSVLSNLQVFYAPRIRQTGWTARTIESEIWTPRTIEPESWTEH